MRLLIIGGSGLLGSHLLREARGHRHTAVGTFHGHREPGLEPLDAARLVDFELLLDKHQPEFVIHAAGWTWVDGCEDDPARAMEENCHQPVRMAEACHSRGVRFAYFSSSYVFDGQKGLYDEQAKPNPINAYARSKWAAEQQLNELTGGQALLLRIICVYGEESRRKNFACQVCDAMRSGRILRLPSDQSGNPTWAGDIARALLPLLGKRAEGVWHLGGPDPDCSRIKWARRLVADFTEAGVVLHPGFDMVEIPTRELGQKAARPLRAGIVSRRLANLTLSGEVNAEVFRRIAQG
jgi:dTDP-4-dehydrorhamnose reductase